MRYVCNLVLIFLLTSCNSQDPFTDFKELDIPTNSEKLSSQLKSYEQLKTKMISLEILDTTNKILPIGKIKMKKDNYLILYALGQLGSYGTFTDGELLKPLVKCKLFKNTILLDSIDIQYEIFDEGVTQEKSFFLSNDNLLKIHTKEEWENLETGEISKLDSTHNYLIESKIQLLSKK